SSGGRGGGRHRRPALALGRDACGIRRRRPSGRRRRGGADRALPGVPRRFQEALRDRRGRRAATQRGREDPQASPARDVWRGGLSLMPYVYANVKVKYGQLPAFFEQMVTIKRVMEEHG